MGEDDDVAQRQDRVSPGFTRNESWLRFRAGHDPKSFMLCPSPLTLRMASQASAGGPGKEALWPEAIYQTLPGESRWILCFSGPIGGDGCAWSQASQ